jgi:hypothetical protein
VLKRPGARFGVTVFAIELGVRLALIATHPTHFSMDAYQRWGGRAHLLIQDWLPATQTMVWGVASLGGGIIATRVLMAIAGALAMTAGAWCARLIGGTAAGWLFIPVGLFGPILTWTTVPYQEGTFLMFLFGGLAFSLAARSRSLAPSHTLWLLADLVFGGLALVRYEGWPVTVLYILWRRDPRASRAVWGMAVWLLIKAMGIESHTASPVQYADWDGIVGRFDLGTFRAALARGAADLIATKGLLLLIGGPVSWWLLFKQRRPAMVLLLLILLGQLAATMGWIIGLEITTIRMHAIPGVLLGLFMAAYLGTRWPTLGGLGRTAVVGGALISSLAFVDQGFNNAQQSIANVRHEARLLKKMQRCADCRFLIKPRKDIGTRDRHDGCEILQGLGTVLHGTDFWCQRWGAAPDSFDASHAARWRKGGYVIREARTSDRQKD